LSALSFAVVLTCVWEYLLLANTQGLIDGGLAGLFWSYIWTFIGFGFVVLSLAEMASMFVIHKELPLLNSLTFIQGSHFWRTVPLGLRIRASQIPEVFELRYR
jgi:hypothetical protein